MPSKKRKESQERVCTMPVLPHTKIYTPVNMAIHMAMYMAMHKAMYTSLHVIPWIHVAPIVLYFTYNSGLAYINSQKNYIFYDKNLKIVLLHKYCPLANNFLYLG